MIELQDLTEICPFSKHSRLQIMLGPLREAMLEFDIGTFQRETAFLAFCADVSCGLTCLRELWGPTAAQTRYEPPGSRALELGNTADGDGFRYRARGLIPIRGKAAYHECGLALSLPLVDHPYMLEEPINAARSAAWRWTTLGLNVFADSNDSERIKTVLSAVGYNIHSQGGGYLRRAQQALA